MERIVDALTHDALQLPPEQRVTLAHRLLNSLEPKENTQEVWKHEIQRRIRAYDEGRSESVPAFEVFEGIKKQLSR